MNYTNATQIYNIASNSWTTGVPAPTPLFGASATIIGSQVYVVGGYSSNLGLLSTLYIYDPATNTWISGPPTPSLHYVFGSASVKNLLYAVGGYNGPAYSAEVDVYDPTAVRFIYAAN